MKTSVGRLGFVVALALPAVSSAQGRMSDAEYCKVLAEKYQTYVSNIQSGQSPMPDPAQIQAAVENCRSGNTAAGIPVLERRLRNARIDLPPRD